jgi:hypothetical protein
MLSGVIGTVMPESMVEGFCWMAGAAFLTAVTPSYLKSPVPLFLIVLLLDVVLWMIVGLDMGQFGPEIKPIIGYLLYAAGWVAIYLVAAIVNNNIFGRVVLPTFGTFVK